MTVEQFYDGQWGSEARRKEANDTLLMFDSAIHSSYSLLGDVSGKKVLEIGAGSGQQMLFFSQQGAEVTAIDISKESVNFLHGLIRIHNLKKAYIHNMDAEEMSFPGNTFDIIYINSTMMHVNHEKVMKECQRVLKSEGKLVILEPLLYNPVMIIYRLFSAYRKTNPCYMSVGRFKKYKSLFSQFSHQEFYFWSLLSLPLFRRHNKSTAIRVSKKLEKIDALFFTLFPFLKPWCWVGVARYVK